MTKYGVYDSIYEKGIYWHIINVWRETQPEKKLFGKTWNQMLNLTKNGIMAAA